MDFRETKPLAAPSIAFSKATRETYPYIDSMVRAALGMPLAAGVVMFVGMGLIAWGGGFGVRVAMVTAGVVIIISGLAWQIIGPFLSRSKETVLGPGYEPKAQPQETPHVEIEISEPAQGRWRLVDVPGTPEQLQQLARGVMLGRPISESEWCGGGRVYSKPDFVRLRAELLARGVLEWRNPDAPAQGVKPSHVGRAVFARLAEQNARTHAQPITGRALLTDGEGE